MPASGKFVADLGHRRCGWPRRPGRPIGAARTSSGMPNASTSSTASGRSAPQSWLTWRVTAFARVEEMRPCSWNQARSRSIVARACRSQRRSRISFRSASSQSLDAPGRRPRGSRARCGRARPPARGPGSSLKTSKGSAPSSIPRLQPPRGAGQDVLLAPAEEVQLVVAVEQVLVALAAGDQVVGEALEELAARGALDHRLPGLAGDETTVARRGSSRRTRRGSRSAGTSRRAAAGSCCRPRRW